MLTAWFTRESRKTLVFRFIGSLHLLFVTFGVYYVVISVGSRLLSPRLSDIVFLNEAFYFRTTINVLLLILQTIAGLRLLRLDPIGVRLTNVFCVGLYVYESFGMFFGFHEGFDLALGATGGTGDMGIALQSLTAYPLIAFVALNLAASPQNSGGILTCKRRVQPGIVLIGIWALLLGTLFVAAVLAFDTSFDISPLATQLLMLVWGTILAIVGVGLLFKREWARFTMIPIAAFLTWAGSSTAGWSSWTIPAILAVFFLAFHSWMIWYLFRRWNPVSGEPDYNAEVTVEKLPA